MHALVLAQPRRVARVLQTPRAGVLSGGALVGALAVGHTATDALTSLLASLLPILQERFALSSSTLALLVATLAFSASVQQPVLGALADRLSPRVGGRGWRCTCGYRA